MSKKSALSLLPTLYILKWNKVYKANIDHLEACHVIKRMKLSCEGIAMIQFILISLDFFKVLHNPRYNMKRSTLAALPCLLELRWGYLYIPKSKPACTNSTRKMREQTAKHQNKLSRFCCYTLWHLTWPTSKGWYKSWEPFGVILYPIFCPKRRIQTRIRDRKDIGHAFWLSLSGAARG